VEAVRRELVSSLVLSLVGRSREGCELPDQRPGPAVGQSKSPTHLAAWRKYFARSLTAFRPYFVLDERGKCDRMDRDRLVAWVAANLLPHEGEVRRWLTRVLASHSDVDDIVQEIYCRVWRAEGIETIANPRAYFFQVAKNIVFDELRRAKVVRFTHLAEVDERKLTYLGPTPEQSAWSREELRHVLAMMDKLPTRCRTIFTMRKVEGLSLREISGRMGLSQTVVQNEVSRALKRLLKIIEEAERSGSPSRAFTKRWPRRG